MESNRINAGVRDYFECGQENEEEQTVIHVATTYYERPEFCLPIFLKWWPEALKHVGVMVRRILVTTPGTTSFGFVNPMNRL